MNKQIGIGVAAVILAGLVPAVLGAEPTHKDVRYAKEYERSVLDIWTVTSDKPAPLVVYFHGGGFKFGDKGDFTRYQFIKKYHSKGVAFASVNYPFMEHVNNRIPVILDHCGEAITFLTTNAKKYNIDPTRISVMGASAGALISCHLGHGTKLSIRSVYAHLQPMGTPFLTVPRLRKDGPPIILYTDSKPDDPLHHPDNATAVHNRCKQLGVVSEVYGSKGTGLPELPKGEDIHDKVMALFYKSWELPIPGKMAPK